MFDERTRGTDMDISEQILNLLRDNARISVEDISAMTKTSVDEVNAVIKKLEDDGVIMKYAAIINPEKDAVEKSKVRAEIEIQVAPEREHGFDGIGNHGILTAHDTCDAHRAFPVIDHQYIMIQFSFLSIQGGEYITVFGPLYDNLMAADGIEVIGMHGLAILFHDIVGDIYDIIDGSDTHGCKPALHPFR